MEKSGANTAVLSNPAAEPLIESDANTSAAAAAVRAIGESKRERLVTPSEAQVVRNTPALLVLLASAAAFSIALILFVLLPALQTLLSSGTSFWSPGP
jgi:hypothetical protein